MEKLITDLVEKAGLSPEMAQKALPVVLNFVKDKLPAGLSEHAEDLLQGKMDLSTIIAQLTQGGGAEGGLGGMFDKVKDIFGGDQK
ncbi:hypothetical protein J5U18_03315 [Sphingobacteriaceae bacterium WQ 2009]|uniref:DUF2267 domain-containing protein n=1 Tax=Rhinopithecimicrobium faecis TaxID=2820698 RepID=A0A8T4H6C5_9SPHI|nr:hypothetical protein [Sphingobacteriaceae bacterium WQ 2009]